jgi:hypothetical protein
MILFLSIFVATFAHRNPIVWESQGAGPEHPVQFTKITNFTYQFVATFPVKESISIL